MLQGLEMQKKKKEKHVTWRNELNLHLYFKYGIISKHHILNTTLQGLWNDSLYPSLWLLEEFLHELLIQLPSPTNSSPLKIGHPKRKLTFQPSISRCYVSFREGIYIWMCTYVWDCKYWAFLTTSIMARQPLFSLNKTLALNPYFWGECVRGGYCRLTDHESTGLRWNLWSNSFIPFLLGVVLSLKWLHQPMAWMSLSLVDWNGWRNSRDQGLEVRCNNWRAVLSRFSPSKYTRVTSNTQKKTPRNMRPRFLFSSPVMNFLQGGPCDHYKWSDMGPLWATTPKNPPIDL